MKVRKYKSLNSFFRYTKTKRITLENLCSMQVYIEGRGWRPFSLPASVLDELFDGMAHVIWKKPTDEQKEGLKKCGGRWFTSRVEFEGGKYPRYSYSAGQEYNGEIRSIQHTINNL